MTPERLVLVLLVGSSGVLTVVLLGCLRSLADLRLELAAGQRRGAVGAALATGRPLPEAVANELPWLGEDGLVLFLSSDCPLCTELRAILPDIKIRNLAFGVIGERAELLDELGPMGVVLSEATARAAADEFGLEYVPLGIHQRDGVIVGSIHTEALASIEEIERFWQFGGATLLEVAA
jgi:hypothetical protein